MSSGIGLRSRFVGFHDKVDCLRFSVKTINTKTPKLSCPPHQTFHAHSRLFFFLKKTNRHAYCVKKPYQRFSKLKQLKNPSKLLPFVEVTQEPSSFFLLPQHAHTLSFFFMGYSSVCSASRCFHSILFLWVILLLVP